MLSSGTLVNKEHTSKEHIVSLLCLCDFAQSKKWVVFDCELVSGDRLGNSNQKRGKVVIICVHG